MKGFVGYLGDEELECGSLELDVEDPVDEWGPEAVRGSQEGHRKVHRRWGLEQLRGR